MSKFIMTSIVASLLLTLILNGLPLIFPNAAAKMQQKIEANARRAIEQHQDNQQPRVRVFVPWKAMLIISILLTIIVNVVGWLSR